MCRPTKNKNAKVALLCIYLSLLAFIVTFLSGAGNPSQLYDGPPPADVASQPNEIPASDQRVEPDAGPCSAATALLHFFLLATFAWNSVYGAQLVLLFQTLRTTLPPYWTRLSHAIGWGTDLKYWNASNKMIDNDNQL